MIPPAATAVVPTPDVPGATSAASFAPVLSRRYVLPPLVLSTVVATACVASFLTLAVPLEGGLGRGAEPLARSLPRERIQRERSWSCSMAAAFYALLQGLGGGDRPQPAARPAGIATRRLSVLACTALRATLSSGRRCRRRASGAPRFSRPPRGGRTLRTPAPPPCGPGARAAPLRRLGAAAARLHRHRRRVSPAPSTASNRSSAATVAGRPPRAW